MTKSRDMAGPVTMHSVAKAAGVSPMTVSNTFKYPERVQEETRRRVCEVAAELGYIPNHAAGNLASGQSRVIGAVIPSIKNSSFYKYVRGMQDAAAQGGYELVLQIADTKRHEMAAIRTFIGLRVAGLTLVGNEHEDQAADLLRKTGVPVVEAWVHGDPLDMAVGYSSAAATRAMVDHLVAAGRQHIGFVGYAGDVAGRYTERLPAFEQRMREYGLEPHLCHLADEADGFGAGSKALDALCRMGASIDAVLCPTDIVAAGVLFECGRRGWKVPERLAVAGWGDYEIASEISPQLTTIQPNAYEMGHSAIEMVIARSSGLSVQMRTRDTGFGVVERASTRLAPIGVD
jgi:LacI family gluconate utilization system Gnt-I transcriptional repressor